MQAVQKYCCFSFSPCLPNCPIKMGLVKPRRNLVLPRHIWACSYAYFRRVMDTRQHPFHFRVFGFLWINHKAAKWRGKLERVLCGPLILLITSGFSEYLVLISENFQNQQNLQSGDFENFPRTGRVLWMNWKTKPAVRVGALTWFSDFLNPGWGWKPVLM
jgi:hypothetical protein